MHVAISSSVAAFVHFRHLSLGLVACIVLHRCLVQPLVPAYSSSAVVRISSFDVVALLTRVSTCAVMLITFTNDWCHHSCMFDASSVYSQY